MQFTPFGWYKLKNIAVLKNNLQSYFTNDIIRDPNFLSMSFSRRRVVTYHSATSSTIHWNPSSKYWRQPTVGDNIRHGKVHLPGSIANWSRLTTLRHISLDSSTLKVRPPLQDSSARVMEGLSVVKEGISTCGSLLWRSSVFATKRKLRGDDLVCDWTTYVWQKRLKG